LSATLSAPAPPRAARAKANGQSLGRKPQLTPHQQHEAIQRRDRGEALGSIARSYNVSPSTISRLTKLSNHDMTDKLDAASRQLDCAIRLVAAHDDELAVHTLVMATFGILNDLASVQTQDYELIYKPYFTGIGWSRLTQTANFLKHADRDPDAIVDVVDPQENDWRIGFCLLLYRSLKGTLSPTMAAFHNWMTVRHPDEFQLAEDADKAFEQVYRHSISVLKSAGRDVEMFLLTALIETYRKGIISVDTGFARRPRH
jgi:hypothetical protein